MKARINVNCPAGRYKVGDIGTVLVNNSEKYCYFIELEEVVNTPFGMMKRCFYFYDNEVTLLEEG